MRCGPAAGKIPVSRQGLRQRSFSPVASRTWHKAGHSTEKNRKHRYRYDKTLYKRRNIIERTFGRLKDYRTDRHAL